MSKAHRGKGIKEIPNKGRNICPICNRSGVKLLYEHEVDGQKSNICKICKANLKNKKLKEASEQKAASSAE